jgi:hypothetical protein
MWMGGGCECLAAMSNWVRLGRWPSGGRGSHHSAGSGCSAVAGGGRGCGGAGAGARGGESWNPGSHSRRLSSWKHNYTALSP